MKLTVMLAFRLPGPYTCEASLKVYQSPSAAINPCRMAGAAMSMLERRAVEKPNGSNNRAAWSTMVYGMAKSIGCKDERSW